MAIAIKYQFEDTEIKNILFDNNEKAQEWIIAMAKIHDIDIISRNEVNIPIRTNKIPIRRKDGVVQRYNKKPTLKFPLSPPLSPEFKTYLRRRGLNENSDFQTLELQYQKFRALLEH
jgi:hypothetical protein